MQSRLLIFVAILGLMSPLAASAQDAHGGRFTIETYTPNFKRGYTGTFVIIEQWNP